MKKILIYILFILTNIFINYHLSLAYYYEEPVLNGTMILKINNSDKITITLFSSTLNLSSSKIKWYVDNKELLAGVGEKTIRINNNNKPSQNILIDVESGGEKYNVKTNIYNNKISFVWENLTGYIPSWYNGRTLASEGSIIRVWSLINLYDNNKLLDKNNLYYEWSLSGTKILSGQNKDYVDIEIPKINLGRLDIKLKITDTNNKTFSEMYSIPIVPTELELYYVNNDGLIWNLKENSQISEKIWTLILEPFYANTNNSPKYSFDINNNYSVSNLPYKKITSPDNYNNSINISAAYTNSLKYIQNKIKSIKININTQNN